MDHPKVYIILCNWSALSFKVYFGSIIGILTITRCDQSINTVSGKIFIIQNDFKKKKKYINFLICQKMWMTWGTYWIKYKIKILQIKKNNRKKNSNPKKKCECPFFYHQICSHVPKNIKLFMLKGVKQDMNFLCCGQNSL